MSTFINATTPGLSLTSTLFILDFTVTLSLVLEKNQQNIKNKRIVSLAKELYKIAKKELRRYVKSYYGVTELEIAEVKQITIGLYGENQEFDILEAFNVSFLGLSELEYYNPDNKRFMVLRRKVLKMIKLFDPYLTFTDQQNEGWNKYERVVRNIEDSWGKYLNRVRGIDYENGNTQPIASVAV